MQFVPFVAAAIGGAYAAEKIGDWLSPSPPNGISTGQVVTVLAVLAGVWMLTKGRA